MRVAADLFSTEWKTPTPVAWNKLFRLIGIDGAVDTGGVGIIHGSEPTQAVFFSVNSVKNVKRYYNKYSPKLMKKGADKGALNVEFAKKFGPELNSARTIKELLPIFNEHGYQLIQLIKDPRIRALVIDYEPAVFKYVKNPTAVEQVALLDAGPDLLGNIPIKKIDQQALIELLSSDRSDSFKDELVLNILGLVENFNKMFNLTPGLQVAIVSFEPRYILTIKNPYAAAIKAAVENWNEDVRGQIPYEIKVLAGLPTTIDDNPEVQRIKHDIDWYEGAINFANQEINTMSNDIALLKNSTTVDDSTKNTSIKYFNDQIKDKEISVKYYLDQISAYKEKLEKLIKTLPKP